MQSYPHKWHFFTRIFSLHLEGPLLSPVLTGRLSGAYHRKGAQFTGALDGADLGEERDTVVSASLYLTPGERFRSIVSAT